MSIGEDIKRIRIEKKMTQQELGQKLGGISQQQIGRWESNKANPKIETIQKIASALKVPVEDLLISYSSELAKKGLDAVNMNNTAIANIAATGVLAEKEMRSALESNGYVLPEDKPLLQHYHELNETGQAKAIEQVELLTKIPEYRGKTRPTNKLPAN